MEILISFGAVEDGAQALVLTILWGGDLGDNFHVSNLSSAHLAKPPPLLFQPHFKQKQQITQLLALGADCSFAGIPITYALFHLLQK